jgi:hypothetical protein
MCRQPCARTARRWRAGRMTRRCGPTARRRTCRRATQRRRWRTPASPAPWTPPMRRSVHLCYITNHRSDENIGLFPACEHYQPDAIMSHSTNQARFGWCCPTYSHRSMAAGSGGGTARDCLQAWCREGAAQEALQQWEPAAQAYFEAFRLNPDAPDFAQVCGTGSCANPGAAATVRSQPA